MQRKTNLLDLSSNEDVHRFLDEHIQEKVASLGLRFSGKVNFSLPEVLEWISALQKAESKLPTWYQARCILTKRATEQASSEEAAKYKASLYAGNSMLNLCGGLGVDDVAFSRNFNRVSSLEVDEELQKISSENDKLLNRENIERIHIRAEDFLADETSSYDFIYADPDRRSGEKRLVSLKDCVPDIPGNWDKIQKISPRQLLKLSPMYPLEQLHQELPGLYCIEVVSIQGEVKEVLAHFKTAYTGNVLRKAIELSPFQEFETMEWNPFGATSSLNSEQSDLNFYEVHPSIAKAGIANAYADLLGFDTLIPNGIYQLSEKRIREYMGRTFQVIRILEYNKKKFDAYLKEQGIKKANLASRYFKLSPLELKKAHKVQDGGEEYFFFFEHQGKATCVHGRKFNGID